MVFQMRPSRLCYFIAPRFLWGSMAKGLFMSLPSSLTELFLEGAALSALGSKGCWEQDKHSHFFLGPALFSEGPHTRVGHPGPCIVPEERLWRPQTPWGCWSWDLSGEARETLRTNHIYTQVTLVSLVIKGKPEGRGRIPERK